MIDFDFNLNCTGCSVCADVCPQKCIVINEDDCGYLVPQVDKERCINCSLCNRVCPHLNNTLPNQDIRRAYCAYNNDSTERQVGSSGSIMILLAKSILERGGVVYGASFDENLQLRHTRACNIFELSKQLKSKYIQSDTRGVYISIKNDLKAGKEVMFVGTPCQTVALQNFIPKGLRDSLLLVDFVCHGVPSQRLFNDAISAYESKNKCHVTGFSFREKSERNLRNYKIIYEKDGVTGEEIGDETSFPYYYAFLKHYGFRNSCFCCQFAKHQRVSDITLGDMWGIENITPQKEFTKGFSLIYTNTEKGSNAFLGIQGDTTTEEYQLSDVRLFNYAYSLPTEKNLWNYIFRYLYSRYSYPIVERILFKKEDEVSVIHKIGLLLVGKTNKYYMIFNKINHGR